MSLLIRKMLMNDLEQVTQIDAASFSLPWPARSFQFELTDNPASRSWVAELDGLVVGMIVAWLIVDDIHIATLAVYPEYRRRGVGRALLTHALTAAKAEGALRSFLEVRESNLAARKMYLNFGFVEDGLRKRYYKDNNENAVLMSLDRISA